MQEVNKFNYLGVMIITDGNIGEEVADRVLRVERFWEREHDIQRSITGVIGISNDTNRGLWFGDVFIKCTEEEKNRSI